jgi:hypothetical protein
VGVAFDQSSVDRLEARMADDRDVLAELGGQLLALLLELLLGARATLLDRLQHSLAEPEQLAVVGDRLRLAADRGRRRPIIVVPESVVALAEGERPHCP